MSRLSHLVALSHFSNAATTGLRDSGRATSQSVRPVIKPFPQFISPLRLARSQPRVYETSAVPFTPSVLPVIKPYGQITGGNRLTPRCS